MTTIQIASSSSRPRCGRYALTFLMPRSTRQRVARERRAIWLSIEAFLHFKYAVFVLVKADKVEVQVLYAVLVEDVRGLQQAS